MNKTGKKFLGILIVAILIITVVLPVSAFAGDSRTPVSSVTFTDVRGYAVDEPIDSVSFPLNVIDANGQEGDYAGYEIIKLYKSADGSNWTEIPATGNFEVGYFYKFDLELNSADGYMFIDPVQTGGTIVSCEIDESYFNSTFNSDSQFKITIILNEITDPKIPITGFSANVSKPQFGKTVASINATFQVTGTPEGSVAFDNIVWEKKKLYSSDPGDIMNETDIFESGYEYAAEIFIEETEGYAFEEETINGTFNGESVTASVDDGVAIFNYDFGAVFNPVTNIAATVSSPEIGKKVSEMTKSITGTPSDAKIIIDSINWWTRKAGSTGDWTKMNDTDVFAAGNEYKIELFAGINDMKYEFVSSTTGSVNGTACTNTVYSSSVTACLNYSFGELKSSVPKTGDTENIMITVSVMIAAVAAIAVTSIALRKKAEK